ncbi:MAG: hypothetical protein COU07_02040 [Candidatus Harrisonbacteria bacterium CG10_big_fil_rev_8_21_14_0_10_40_38]|uniref:GlxA-like beta barrel domain-containing protein n=1 Tax=Candidatus Harrisonbacteria bacterium CG10_big_fil_rev_8_21_14_0_10_40_38 TaxID=1974583 RepID=A0A2H0US21_9BACT|nr:MAG: hypothetical protein COU07_02040 [Candidatus Harrisonbacteria bacterium CG10_big_fil_rev_8_21_14_0_10_40_38]
MNVHKITIGKSDEPAFIAEKIIDAKAEAVLLTIPRFSKLGESDHNFSLLKREAESVGTQLLVESIDDDVLKLCKALDIECFNPFFGEPPRHFSDISHGKSSAPDSRVELVASRTSRIRGNRGSSRVSSKTQRSSKSMFSRKTFLLSIIFLVVLGGLVFGLVALPKADVSIVAVKASWNYNDSVRVDKNISDVDPEKLAIPGQLFFQNKNLQLSFPATSKKQVSQKASGIITIFNEFSSDSQPLVATTRFETPDGKIFRITKSVVVPGAKVVDGKISEPGSIKVEVVADKPGESYNIGPVERFTIPGFAGTPKFKNFYGSSDSQMAGGFVGEAPYPSDAELEEAKKKASGTLEDSIKSLVKAQLPAGFTLVDGATRFEVTSQVINLSSDSNGTFSISTEGSLTLMLFKEADVLKLLHESFEKDSGDGFDVKSETLKYGDSEFNIDDGYIGLPISYDAIFAKHIDIQDIKGRIAGKTEDEIKPILFSVPGLESAQVSLWPFWVRSVPSDDKITVTVD